VPSSLYPRAGGCSSVLWMLVTEAHNSCLKLTACGTRSHGKKRRLTHAAAQQCVMQTRDVVTRPGFRLAAFVWLLAAVTLVLAREGEPDKRKPSRFEKLCGSQPRDPDPSFVSPQLLQGGPPRALGPDGRVHRGWVCAQVTVSVEGSVKEVKVTKGSDWWLMKATTEKLKEWKYHPASRGGRPTEYSLTVLIESE